MDLYVDEDVAREVALALRESHNVTYVPETMNRGETDAWHLKRASDDRRVLITGNHRDFNFLHRVWTSIRVFGASHGQHAGILTATRNPKKPEPWIAAINRELSAGRSMNWRPLVWHAGSPDGWREDDWRPDD